MYAVFIRTFENYKNIKWHCQWNICIFFSDTKGHATKKWEIKPKLKESWSTVPVYFRNNYENIEMRLDGRVGMNQPVVLDINDPRWISDVLAPIPPPPTEEIVTKQKSHFKLKWFRPFSQTTPIDIKLLWRVYSSDFMVRNDRYHGPI